MQFLRAFLYQVLLGNRQLCRQVRRARQWKFPTINLVGMEMTPITNDDVAGALTEERLVQIISDEAKQAWDSHNTAYLLSLLAPKLKQMGLDYKEVTGSNTLSKWAATVAQEKFDVIRDPNTKARIGVVPRGVVFDFSDPETDNHSDPVSVQARPKLDRYRKPVIVRFLEELSKLSSDELATVVIPVPVIVKLMNEK